MGDNNKRPPPYIVLPQTNEPLERILWRCGYKSSWGEIREQVYRFNVESSLKFQIYKARVDAYNARVGIYTAMMQAGMDEFQRRFQDRTDDFNKLIESKTK